MKIPTDSKDVKALREFLTTVRTQVCGMADALCEPWKSHFESLKKNYDDVISGLPPTDAVPAAMEANHNLQSFFSCLYSASALSSMLGSALNSMMIKKDEDVAAAVTVALNSAVSAELKKRMDAGELVLKADVDPLVSAAIEARTKTGDLVPKELHTQMCSAAKDLGLSEGEQKVRDEMAAVAARATLISTRKAHLQTCSLPFPDAKLEAVLAGTDEEFSAAQKTAEERIAALRKGGIALNSKSPLMAKVWLPQDQYEVFADLAKDSLKGADPLVVTPGAPTITGPFMC